MPAALLALLATLLNAGDFTVVADHQPVATIVTGEAGDARLAVARLLQDYVRQATGATLPILEAADARPALHVGRSPAVDRLDLGVAALDDDGFVLQGVDTQTWVIAGPTDWGTEFGVTEFLERYLGVRWLLPGPAGTDVPRQATVRVPLAAVRQEPAFFSRQMSGLRGAVQAEWARRNRMHGRVSFHHNLLKLFPPSRYVASHPEFFPVYGGRRYLPQTDEDPRWQPNLAAPGLAAEAAANIKAYFRAHPEATSYSLGMNDTSRWDESPESLAREAGRQNYLGQRDVSDSYYQWCNEVVEEVLREFPDKWFGCLAYNNVAEPPTRLQLHPRIIPYLTYDRMKWVEPDLRAAGEDLTRRWHAMSPTLGWYDYAYGSPYCLPRVYPHQMATYLRFGRDHGVRAHYAELYPNWGEGPKPYLFLKLQWNPDLDVDAVLEDWYQRCVGPTAAPALREYYAIWERFWTATAPRSAWWTARAQYLAFSSPAYLSDVDPADVRRSRELLDQCLAAADTPERQSRAALLRDAFAYYEASALAWQAEQRGRTQPPRTEAAALAALDGAATAVSLAAERLRLIDSWQDHPILVHPLDYAKYGALAGSGWGTGALWQCLSWAGRSAAVKARVEALAASGPPAVKDTAEALLAVLGGVGQVVNPNPSLEAGAAPWSMWVADVGRMVRSDEAAQTGRFSVLCDGVRRGGPNQVLPIQPGRYVVVGYALVPAGQASQGTVAVSATMRGDDNLNLPSPQTLLTPTPGEWTPLICAVTVPERIRDTKVTKVLLVAIVDGFRPGEKVYVDDLTLIRLP